jgi:hypothetical protein
MLPARSAPLDVVGPGGTADLLSRLAAAYGDWVTAPGFQLTIASWRLESARTSLTGFISPATRFPTPRKAWHIAWSAEGDGSSTPAIPGSPNPSLPGPAGAMCCCANALSRRAWAFPST